MWVTVGVAKRYLVSDNAKKMVVNNTLFAKIGGCERMKKNLHTNVAKQATLPYYLGAILFWRPKFQFPLRDFGLPRP